MKAGEVTSSSAILWSHADQKGEVRVEVATDPIFHHYIHAGNLKSRDTSDFTVQEQVGGLSPALACTPPDRMRRARRPQPPTLEFR